jgi:hypothetical protein
MFCVFWGWFKSPVFIWYVAPCAKFVVLVASGVFAGTVAVKVGLLIVLNVGWSGTWDGLVFG